MIPYSRSRRARKGMTLLELTIVILVLLSLISILFMGARAWMRGADRSGCIMNIRNAQTAVRAYQNTRGISEGVSINMMTDIIGPTNFMALNPQCPGGGTYQLIDHIPYAGELAIECNLSGILAHVPASYSDW